MKAMTIKCCIYKILFLLLFLGVSNKLIAQIEKKTNENATALKHNSFEDMFNFADQVYAKNHVLTQVILDTIALKAYLINDYKNVYQAYLSKGSYLERELSYQEAYKNYYLAYQVILNKEPQLARDILIFIGNTKRSLFQYSEARDLYLSCLHESIKAKDAGNIQNAYCALGILYSNIEDYENTIKYFEKAAQSAEKAKNTINAAIYLDNLSEVYCLNKQYSEALYHIEKACQLADKDQDFNGKIFLYERYGRIFADMGKFEEAHAKFEAAIALCPEFGTVRDLKNLSIAKAELYLKEGKTDLAEAAFKETLADLSLMNVNNLIKVYHELGKIKKNKQDFNSALAYFEQSQKLATENLSLRYEEWNHRALFEIFDKRNQPAKALFHLKRANILHDSLFNYEKMERVTELQFKYDYAQNQQLLKEKEVQNNRILMYAGAVIALLIVASLGYFLYHRNQTNQRLIEKNERIKAQKRQLEDSNVMLKQFNYAVAHDLKEPLRGIGNFVKVIQRRYVKDLPEEAHEYFNFVTSGVGRMGGMLDGLLKYSMISMNQVTDIEDIALKDILNDVTSSLQLSIAENHAEIIIPENLPTLHINRVHATQLIQNLVSNALKFVEKCPKIEISSSECKEKLRIMIKDNGIGISKEDGIKLFQLFNRVHSDTTRFEGTGIGLALCKNIVEKYNGKIWFESEENNGTQFFIELPKAA